MTDVLMITTTVRMFNWIHCYTTYRRPTVAFSLVFMISATGLEYRLVGTSTTGNDSYQCDTSMIDKNIKYYLPIIARFDDWRDFLRPDGKRTRVNLVSGLCAITVA
jgi:hypothetical protein